MQSGAVAGIIARMLTLSDVVLIVFAVGVLGCLVAFLRVRAKGPEDELRAARSRLVILGVLVVLSALLNVFQYAVGFARYGTQQPLAPAPVAAAARAESSTPTTEPATPPLLADPAKQRILDEYAKLFYETPAAWHSRTWLGVGALQNPNDAWMHQEIIVEQRPDYIIECGSAAGGGALYWAMVLREANPAGKVITIDIERFTQDAERQPLWKERVEQIIGSSTDPEIVAKLAERVRGKKVLVILDSDHRKPHVLNELKAYSPMVPVGGYLIVQDTTVHGHPVMPDHEPGPMEALDEFLKTNDSFEIDRSREAMLHSMHPRGYLKRVK